jgi:hypothetical protein
LRFDVVIANDLFPNVDQRLALFLDKFLPVANEIRLSLTYYNQPRFYRCRSLTSEEIFCMLAWDGEQTARTLMRYREQVVGAGFSELERQGPSLYENGRQVCLVTLRGPTE